MGDAEGSSTTGAAVALEDERRLRGRLCSPVTVWTSGSPGSWAGLTVSATLVAARPARCVIGLVGGRSALWRALETRRSFVLHVLEADHAGLADRFSRGATGRSPFEGVDVEDTPFGPALSAIGTRAFCRVIATWPVGYQHLVQGEIEALALDDMNRPLIHFRGAYRTLEGAPPRA